MPSSAANRSLSSRVVGAANGPGCVGDGLAGPLLRLGGVGRGAGDGLVDPAQAGEVVGRLVRAG